MRDDLSVAFELGTFESHSANALRVVWFVDNQPVINHRLVALIRRLEVEIDDAVVRKQAVDRAGRTDWEIGYARGVEKGLLRALHLIRDFLGDGDC